MSKLRILGVALSPIALMLLSDFTIAAQQVEVIPEDNHGLSAPLRSLSYEPLGTPTVRPWPRIPRQNIPTVDQDDPALQEVASPMVATTPGLNVLGLGTGFPGFTVQFEPPDTNAAVGATQVVENVNLSLAVFNKSTGAIVAGPTSLNTLWTGVDTTCSSGAQSDPVVLYDQQAGRWVIEMIAGAAGTFLPPNKFCMAVSTTSDATGTYHAYAFRDSTGLNDYSKVGIWPDAYYVSTRQFNASQTAYLGPKGCAANRAAMIAGTAATMQCFQVNNANADGMLPSNLDGSTAPPAGSPNYFLLIPLPSFGTGTSLQMFKFHVDFTTPSNSTFTGPTVITVARFTEASSFGGFVPQLGTSNKLDGVGFTLMHRLAYRNFPNATPPHESLVVTHSIVTGPGTSRRYGTRWYEIRSPGATPVVHQQGTFSPDATYRWMGSIAMDKAGDIALGYSASSSTTHPSIRYTGRVPTDALGTMEAEATILAGPGSQTSGGSQPYRWGDYSSMSIDPVDGCTFWYSQEYSPHNGGFNWATHLFSFKFTACH
jgi:hypothetical protein